MKSSTTAQRKHTSSSSSSSSSSSPLHGWLNALLFALMVGVFVVISGHLEQLETMGTPLLVTLQGYRSPSLDAFVRLCSALGLEFFFILIPFALFWATPVVAEKVEEVLSDKTATTGGMKQSATRTNKKNQTTKTNKKEPKTKAEDKHQAKAAAVEAWGWGMELMLLLLVTWFSNAVLKSFFARPRPYVSNIEFTRPTSVVDNEYSFPSGHSCAAAICWLYLGNRLKAYDGVLPQLVWLATRFGILLTFLASFSRLYFGVHYPHDVVSGWLCAAMVYIVFKHLFLHPVKERTTVANVKRRLQSLTLVFVVMMGVSLYIGYDSPVDDNHMGIYFCPGAILALIVSLVKPPFDPHTRAETDNKSKGGLPVWKQLLRLCIGLAGATCMSTYQALHMAGALNNFLRGVVSTSWLVWATPFLFYYWNLHY
eukprot:TRINITY_DN4779_c0_g1_i1.p1 TRINITY_DN4779_c0_g1~~TRINITY_DN4779_c0_g1_i1.p1  ORF type:complete len:436 (+),score=62.73 TRINITY_DN4779_c0_g1_i1:34-1308(+)